MSRSIRVGMASVALLVLPSIIFSCITSDQNAAPDAGFDAGKLDASMIDVALDTSTSPDVAAIDAPAETQAEAAVDAGPPVLEVLGQALASPIDIAVNATHIYILESATSTDDSGNVGAIRRCPIAGCGGAPTVVVTSASVPSGIALSGNTLFYTDSFNKIVTCDITSLPCTGTTFVGVLDDAGGGGFPTQLLVRGTHLYWFTVVGSDRLIQTCPVTGCTSGYPKTVLNGTTGTALVNTSTSGIALDDSFVYVTLFNGGPVLRYAMTNSEAANAATEAQLATTPFATHVDDLDGTTLRWAESGGTKVSACTTPACTTVVDVVTGRVTPYTVRHDATYIYGADQGTSWNTGVLWRLRKP